MNTSYLIRMVVGVISDMRYFLFILFITILAFGDSFLSISLGNVADSKDENGNDLRFVNNFFESLLFTYRIILGDFDTNSVGNVAVPLVLMFFVLCTLMNMIIMLNLLISIISHSFRKVN